MPAVPLGVHAVQRWPGAPVLTFSSPDAEAHFNKLMAAASSPEPTRSLFFHEMVSGALP